MGVVGLTTYINDNQDMFLKKFYLHDTCLVIDGHSLIYKLHERLNYPAAVGGDYDKYAFYTRTFFQHLRKCNVTSYVLFDGSYEERKLNTAYSRLKSRINEPSRIDAVSKSSTAICPLQLRDVFKEVLNEMAVAFTVCEFEADTEIAALASHLNCPVLSSDSDFYIYNVLYIPFNTLWFNPEPITVGTDTTIALQCKVYRVDHVTKSFRGFKEEVMPLLATLLGNDYLENRVFYKFFSRFNSLKGSYKTLQQKHIHGLFLWLQNETLESAIPKIVGHLYMTEDTEIKDLIKKSINSYKLKDCRSLKYFFTYPEETKEAVKQLAGSDNASSIISEAVNNSEIQELVNLPKWFIERIRNNKIPLLYIELYTLRLYFCHPQAEDYADDDAFLCNLPILRYAFDMLNDFSVESFTYVSRQRDENYRSITVDRSYAVGRPLQIDFKNVNEQQLKLYFFNFLKVKLPSFDLEDIKLLPDNYQLCMLAILWWIANCNVMLSNVHSLFICYIMLDVIDEKTNFYRGHADFYKKYGKQILNWKKNPFILTFNKDNIQYEDCLIAASELLKLFDLDVEILRKPFTYVAKQMHSFAQFQCCLQQMNFLNTLCGSPFQSTKYSRCFNGTFLFNMSTKLKNQENPRQFIKSYLKGAKTILKFYESLCEVFENCAKKMDLKTIKFKNEEEESSTSHSSMNNTNLLVKEFKSNVNI